MFKKLNFDLNKVYPTLVVSTMSSGKSTLINALVGTELLPNMNRACTAKAVAILDNDWKTDFMIHAVDSEGKYTLIEQATKQLVSDFNKTNNVSEMIIEGEVKGIKNSKKSLLLVDTPGINNSLDHSHEEVTIKVLEEYPEGLILYIINAAQIGTYDDCNFLSHVAQKLNGNDKFKIIFVVNKMDLIDPVTENPVELIENCREYIIDQGFENPVLIPVSSSSALIFKKVLAGIDLSEMEEEEFYRFYRRFKREGFSLQDYSYIPQNGKLDSTVSVDGIEYTRAQVMAALDNTGIPLLEKVVDETLVRSLKMRAPEITAKDYRKKSRKENQGILKGKNKNESGSGLPKILLPVVPPIPPVALIPPLRLGQQSKDKKDKK